MPTITRRTLLSGLAGALVLRSSVRADDATPLPGSGYAHPEWLIDGPGLRDLLASGAPVKGVALTPAKDFAAGHIPGAVQVDYPALEIVETSDQRVAIWRGEVEGVLTGLGIARGDTVVIYDGGTFYGARLWWILDQLGHADKRMLNGGLGSWRAAGGELETGAVAPVPASVPYAGAPNDDDIATIAEVAAIVAAPDPDVVLVDARRPDEYAAGHIPGALNLDFRLNALPDDPTTWKPADELRAMYAAAGITPDKRVIPYCTTGVRSAVTFFTLRLIGYERVSLFTGSFKEWSADPARSVTKGPNP